MTNRSFLQRLFINKRYLLGWKVSIMLVHHYLEIMLAEQVQNETYDMIPLSFACNKTRQFITRLVIILEEESNTHIYLLQ